jgi:hypothetical protein
MGKLKGDMLLMYQALDSNAGLSRDFSITTETARWLQAF